MKGIIACDIDGTLTEESKGLESDVADYLHSLHKDGWHFIFITGRTFLWAMHSLNELTFPYALALQNGAILIEMPSQKVILKHYINGDVFDVFDETCQNEPTDYVVYSGYENNDICYWRPKKFSAFMLEYVKERTAYLNENWQAVQSFDELPVQQFASIKCFGNFESAQYIAARLQKHTPLHAPAMKDAFRQGRYIIQATHPLATKGSAMLAYAKTFFIKVPLIAAGDDFNDVSMLDQADIKIVMGSAPKEVLAMADVIAPSAMEKGIIQGLASAIRML